jgi:hypothetical protein
MHVVSFPEQKSGRGEPLVTTNRLDAGPEYPKGRKGEKELTAVQGDPKMDCACF